MRIMGGKRETRPVGDEGRERPVVKEELEIAAGIEVGEVVEPNLDEVGAAGLGGGHVGHHLLHRLRHQRYAQQRHSLFLSLSHFPSLDMGRTNSISQWRAGMRKRLGDQSRIPRPRDRIAGGNQLDRTVHGIAGDQQLSCRPMRRLQKAAADVGARPRNAHDPVPQPR